MFFKPRPIGRWTGLAQPKLGRESVVAVGNYLWCMLFTRPACSWTRHVGPSLHGRLPLRPRMSKSGGILGAPAEAGGCPDLWVQASQATLGAWCARQHPFCTAASHRVRNSEMSRLFVAPSAFTSPTPAAPP